MIKENPKLLEFDIVETPNFISAYKELASLNIAEINSKLAFRLYDTFGIDEESITKLAKALGVKFQADQLLRELENAKTRSKQGTLALDNKLYWHIVNERVPKTDDSSKYIYLKGADNKYIFKDVNVEVLKIYDREYPVEEVQIEHYCSLLLDKTNFYSEAGGQVKYKNIRGL